MRQLPLDDPGTADHRSPARFLWWVARMQWPTLLGGMFFGVIWMSSQALLPLVLGRAIDEGVAARDTDALLRYVGLMLAVGLVQAVSGIVRHRFAVSNWLIAAYRVVQLVGRQAVALGISLRRQVPTGEMVAIGSGDLSHVGQVMDVSARFSGAVVSFVVVAVILLQTSVTLGLVVLLGVPLVMALVGPLLAPLQRRVGDQRQLTGDLANTATDIVSGLRVLRGIGGEQVFHDRYRRESQSVRRAGVEVARLHSVIDAMQVLLPGTFVVILVWLGARLAVEGTITPGELVAFYGYAAFLLIPLRTATEYANKLIRGLVASRRICRVLALTADHTDPDDPAPSPPVGSVLADARTGLRLEPGLLTAVVCEEPDAGAALADRLGRCAAEADDAVTLGGTPLTRLTTAEVRRRILVSDTAAMLFAGVLRDGLDPHGRGDLDRALHTADADDVLMSLPDGLDGVVAERGRSFSGGQRQRLVLTRALVADPEVLVLVEPTSAVDAHTEARIAARLREHRAGRTTLVTTSSPLVLDNADVVVLLVDGRVAATGTHAELLEREPAYRRHVTREVTA